MNQRHLRRDSLTGINRKRLRGTLAAKLGVGSNADMFASRGLPWTTTQSDEAFEARQRQLAEYHLRHAKHNEHAFKVALRERLADPGPLEPVKVDKQRLAAERKKEREPLSSRKLHQTKFATLAKRVNNLANLQRELERDDKVAAKTTDQYRDLGHFVLEKD